MLHLYQSNHLEQLGQLLAQMIQAVPLSNHFAAEVIVVQSQGMERWLTLNLAKHANIAAHLDFVLPAAYIWRLMQRTLPALPQKSVFSPDILSLRLLAQLPTLRDPCFAPLHPFCQDELSCFELATRIADVFDQYLVYRPDWIHAWEHGRLLGLGTDEAWQAALWRECTRTTHRHRVTTYQQYLAQVCPEHLPERIILFGIATLAPMYLALFKHLATLTDVCLFLLNPCQEYWGDMIHSSTNAPLFSKDGHPLLRILGQQGRDFFESLHQDGDEPVGQFILPTGNSLLQRLQRDILTLSNPQAETLANHDESIEIHSVHSPMRELEILKNRLLHYLANDPSLQPSDIAVLTPDINHYAPYIDAVFGTSTGSVTIPYSIADHSIKHEEPLLNAFNAVLTLMESRFYVNDVLALLSYPALLRRFHLLPEHIPFIHSWVHRAAIHWGRDGTHKTQLNLPDNPLYSWRWGLDRLLLGSVLPTELAAESTPLFANLLPLNFTSSAAGEILACFATLYEQLEKLAHSWATPATPQIWSQRLLQARYALFDPDAQEEENADPILLKTTEALSQDAQLALFNLPITLATVRAWLQTQLFASSRRGFLVGGVTFCAMVPMRSLPFRILCLIGLNDGAYPRDEKSVSFDLIASNPRRGDRSRRVDDRYLFLEALLSAREKLVLSYIAYSVRSNEILPPSALICLLQDVLEQMGKDKAKQAIIHPLHPFDSRNYADDENQCTSFETHWAEALTQDPQAPQPFACTIKPRTRPCVLALNDFLQFWRLPCHAWLAKHLKLHPARINEEIARREPFSFEKKAQHALSTQVLDSTLNKQHPLAQIKDTLRASGLLPAGQLGEACLEQYWEVYNTRFSSLLPLINEPEQPPLTLTLEFSACSLTGSVTHLQSSGRVILQTQAANAPDWLEIWLTHLFLCASDAHPCPPTTLWYADALYQLPFIADAHALLQQCLDYWQIGQENPLPFFPHTSLAYARHLARHPTDTVGALAQAKQAWSPSFGQEKGQAQDPSIKLAFRHLDPLTDPDFSALAQVLLLPLIPFMTSIST